MYKMSSVDSFRSIANQIGGLISTSTTEVLYPKLVNALDLGVAFVNSKEPNLNPRILISTAPVGDVLYDSSKGDNNTWENYQLGKINEVHNKVSRIYIAQGVHNFFSGVAPEVVKSASKSGYATGTRNYETHVLVDSYGTAQFYMNISYD